MINTKIKRWIAIHHRARSFLRVNFVNKHWIAVRWIVCETVNFRVNSWLSEVRLQFSFLSVSEYSRYSAPFTSVNRWTSPQFLRCCSSHPLNPECLVFINNIVFCKASAFKIPSNCLSHKMFTSSSVIGCADLPSFLSSCSNWLPSITLQRYLQAFKCRLKLQISPLELEGSKSSPSFLIVNSYNEFTDIFIKLFWWDFLDSSALIFGVEKLSQQTYISLCLWKSVVLFFWCVINLSIGLSRDTSHLDRSAILKNISYSNIYRSW